MSKLSSFGSSEGEELRGSLRSLRKYGAVGLVGAGSLIAGSNLGTMTAGCSVFESKRVQNPYSTVVIDVEPGELEENASRDKDIANGLAYVCRAEDYRVADYLKYIRDCEGERTDARDVGVETDCLLGKTAKFLACLTADYVECNSRIIEIQSEIITVFGDMFVPCAREGVGWEETRKGCDVGCVDLAVTDKLGRSELVRPYLNTRSECLGILRDCVERED